jgi:hypothetical protein
MRRFGFNGTIFGIVLDADLVVEVDWLPDTGIGVAVSTIIGLHMHKRAKG